MSGQGSADTPLWFSYDSSEPDSAGDDIDPFAPPLPMAERRPDWHDPRAWASAEVGLGRALAAAAAELARLDERLRRMRREERAGMRLRIALGEARDALWLEGERLRPEHLALADAGRIGQAGDNGPAIARAAWAVRRMTAPLVPLDTFSDIRAFLGYHGTPLADDIAEPPDRDLPDGGLAGDLWLGSPDPVDLREWCQTMAAMSGVHPLTRSAAGYHLWRGFALSPPERCLEALVVAARLGARDARGGVHAVPLIAGNPHALSGRSGTAETRLRAWLGAIGAAAVQTQLMLDRIAAWQARATPALHSMHGKAAPALASLLASRPIVSAQDAAAALGITAAQARRLMQRFAQNGLVTELTGQSRFRFWEARL